jgi:hypothetical protein
MTAVSDTFTYSNGALATVSSGVWAAVTGHADCAVASNKLATPATSTITHSRHTTALSTDDQYAEATVNISGSGYREASVLARCSDDAATFYRLDYSSNSTGTLTVYKCEAGSFTLIDDQTGVGLDSNDHTIRIEVEGTSIRGYLDDVEIHNLTDSDISTGAHVGAGLYRTNSGGAPTLDGFSGGDLSSDTPATVTPSATARSITPNAVTVTGAAEVTPAATAAVPILHAVTIHGAAVATFATVARAFELGQVTIDNGAAEATVTPAAIATAAAFAATTQVGGAVAIIGAHAYVIVMPQATPTSPGSVSSDATATTIAVPAVTVEGNSVVETGISVSVTMPTPTLQGGAIIEVASVDATVVASQVAIIIGGADTNDRFIDRVWSA